MKQEYFVVVVAHSLRGRLRRIHIPHQAVYSILALALLGCFSAFGFVASYARMAWKVANYNSLRKEADGLRSRYQNLQKVVNQKNDQLASLELNAKEVAMAYGIKQKLEGPADISAEGKLVPTFAESLEDYNFLRNANLLALQGRRSRGFHPNATPNLWPVEGNLTGSYGSRSDPFSGEGGEFHPGVDICAPIGRRNRDVCRHGRRLRPFDPHRSWRRDLHLLRPSLQVLRLRRPGSPPGRTNRRRGRHRPRHRAAPPL